MAGSPEWELTISLRALQRARTTLEDFTLSYFPYLGLSPSVDFFRHLDTLVWLEASIYQLDEHNELLARSGDAAPSARLLGGSCIRGALIRLGLHDECIEHEIVQADAYWTLERRLTSHMLRAGRANRDGGGCDGDGITLAAVMQAHEAKSFDYRLMFLVLHKAEHAEYNEALLAFLRVDERLVDIGDDLTDYEDDVEANSFNIYRGFVWVYGSAAELKLVALICELEAAHARLLAALPAPLQAHYWARHTQASGGEGGAAGRWSVPPPIYDEAAFRERLLEHERRAAGAGGEAPQA